MGSSLNPPPKTWLNRRRREARVSQVAEKAGRGDGARLLAAGQTQKRFVDFA